MFRTLHRVVPLRSSVVAVAFLTGLAPLRSAEVIDNFSTTNNLYIFGNAISLSAENNILTAERTAGSIDTGFDWRVNWFFSLAAANAQSQLQVRAVQPLQSGYFVINALVFNGENYLGEFTLQNDINATGVFGYDVAAAATQRGFTNANQWFPRIRITPFASSNAAFEFGSLAAVASAPTVVESGTLTVGSQSSLGSGTLALTNGSQILFTASRTITNEIVVAAGSSGLLNASSGRTVTYAGEISPSGGTLIFAGAGASHEVDAVISGAAAGSGLAIDGTTVSVNSASTYNGATFVYGGGALLLGTNNALPVGSALTIGAGASFGEVDLQGFDQTIASLATGSSATLNSLNLGSGTLTVSGSLQTTFAASLSGSGSLVKAGTGTLTLTATNTHSGGTTVSGGRLIVDGVSTNSTFLATSGGALAGQGSVGSTSILEGGILSPGNSPGTLTIEGDLMWANGGRYDWEIFQLAENGGAAGTGWDLVDVTGDLDLSALDGTSPFVISIFSLSGTNTAGPLAGFEYTQDYSWKIAQASQSIAFNPANLATYFTLQTEEFSVYQPGVNGIFSLALGEDGSSLFLNYSGAGATPVPEPATWLAALILIVAATWVSWRHKNRRSGALRGAKQS